MSDLLTARSEAVEEVCRSVLMAAGDAMKRHGDDPHGNVIVAAGFAMAIKAIGRDIDPKMPLVVRELLTARHRDGGAE